MTWCSCYGVMKCSMRPSSNLLLPSWKLSLNGLKLLPEVTPLENSSSRPGLTLTSQVLSFPPLLIAEARDQCFVPFVSSSSSLFLAQLQLGIKNQRTPPLPPTPAWQPRLPPPQAHAQPGGEGSCLPGAGRQLEERTRENSSRSVWQGETGRPAAAGRARRPSPAQTFQKQTWIQLSISPGGPRPPGGR